MPFWFQRKKGIEEYQPQKKIKRGVVRERIGDRDYLNSPYVLPKDPTEMQRLDFQHYMLGYILQGLYLAPIDGQAERMLDSGCGTGRWCLEMADAFPNTEIIGLDLVKPTPTLHRENCVFMQGDITKGLPFVDNYFDFTHQRLLIAALPAHQWQAVVHDLARVTRPGGWVELLELSSQLKNTGPATRQYIDWALDICKLRGIDPLLVSQLGTFLQQAGLANITTQQFDVPIGTWGGRLGQFSLTNFSSLPAAIKPLVLKHLRIPEVHFHSTIQTMLQEVEEYHTSWTFHSAYAQRV